MKWTVNNVLTHKLHNESDEVVALIKHRQNEYVGYSTDRTPFLVVTCSDGQRFAVNAKGNEFDATMELADNGKNAGFRPARADCMNFVWDGSPTCIKQTERREFVLSAANISGRISGMLGMKATIDVSSEDETLAALLYILAYIMLHEDDVDIV